MKAKTRRIYIKSRVICGIYSDVDCKMHIDNYVSIMLDETKLLGC